MNQIKEAFGCANLFHYWLYSNSHLHMLVSHTLGKYKVVGLWRVILPKGELKDDMTQQYTPNKV